MRPAYHLLLLHAHLPFVRHPEHEDFLEEDWLHEAVFETYLPLLRVLRGIRADRIPARITLTMSPPLCAMLRDSLLQARSCRYLALGAEFCRRQAERMDAPRAALAEFYGQRYREALELYERELRCDLVGAFAQLEEDGIVEIATCSATHGFLPLLRSQPAAVRAQILIGRDSHREHFGRDPAGIWLPECAYYPGLDAVLQEAGLRWFVVDAHGLALGTPLPRFGIFAPCFTPSGPAAFGRDRDSSRQVWSPREGYPGDPAYRDFYRDLGQEAPLEDLREVYGAQSGHRYTGVKMHRITGPGADKQFYRRDWALGAADAHAADFLESRAVQLSKLAAQLPVAPVLLSPFDAELFGHWWFEGPEFLNLYLRKAACDQTVFKLETPSGYLARHPLQQVVQPSESSWGHKGFWEVWLNETNAWIYPHLHAAAADMTRLARSHTDGCDAPAGRILAQMARELLLAQASDWAFLMRAGTARCYAGQRTRTHLHRFRQLCEELEAENCSDSVLDYCEQTDNLFPAINWRYFT